MDGWKEHFRSMLGHFLSGREIFVVFFFREKDRNVLEIFPIATIYFAIILQVKTPSAALFFKFVFVFKKSLTLVCWKG